MADINNAAESADQPLIESEENETAIETKSKVFSNPGFTFGELSWALAVAVPGLCLLIAIAEGSSYIWRPIAVVLYIALLLFGLLLLVGLNVKTDDSEESNSDEESDDSEIGLALTLLSSIAVLVAFSQANRHLSVLVGGFIFDQLGFWHWMRFGGSNLLESVLFDLPAIYEWNISEIKPTSMWSRTGILIFRTTIELVIVAMVLRQIGIARQKRKKMTKSPPPESYFALILPRTGQLILIGLWGLPIAIGIGAIVNDGISLGSTLSVIKFGVPLVFGVFLAWNSLRGLWIPGAWNKSLALAGIVGGVLLVREFWPMFRSFVGS